MPKVFVLFALKADTDPDEYERWAASTDAPAVRALPSVDGFTVHRISGALNGTSPYQYIEIVEVNDMEQFGRDIESTEMQRDAGEFQERADGPLFIVGEQFV